MAYRWGLVLLGLALCALGHGQALVKLKDGRVLRGDIAEYSGGAFVFRSTEGWVVQLRAPEVERIDFHAKPVAEKTTEPEAPITSLAEIIEAIPGELLPEAGHVKLIHIQLIGEWFRKHPLRRKAQLRAALLTRASVNQKGGQASIVLPHFEVGGRRYLSRIVWLRMDLEEAAKLANAVPSELITVRGGRRELRKRGSTIDVDGDIVSIGFGEIRLHERKTGTVDGAILSLTLENCSITVRD